MRTWSRPIGVAAALLAACGPSTKATPATVTPPAAAAAAPAPVAAAPLSPPKLRLPVGPRPTRYEVELTLDPSKQELSGIVSIALTLPEATDHLWLNGEEIAVDEAVLVAGDKRVVAAVQTEKHDFLAFRFAEPVGPGAATLNVRYKAQAHKDDGDGIYQVKEGDDFYYFTQFEATDARQAFPCFDEPSYKVPWKLTIRTPEANAAVSNTTPESDTVEGGWRTVRFAETKPLPSYLVALAVGPFEFADAGKGKGGTPIRIITPRGQIQHTAWAQESTAPLLHILEDWFGMPYPYDKLDIIAVPVFNAGAMENPGLITYRAPLVVVKPEDATEYRKRGYATTTAHELAHQWFGNYVTLAFWDDTWLNESFATWMERKTTIKFRPEWELEVSRAGGKSGSMSADSLANARKVRQPIESDNDIKNAFDGITYGKGSAVLFMLEQWLGEDVMQKGVMAYVQKHAHGNATYADFLAALSAAAGKDLAGPLGTFIEQVGVPLVGVELSCAKGQAPTLALTQQRYLPIGSKASKDQVWHVPVCVRYGSGKTAARECTLLTEKTGTFALATRTCPEWVMPDAGGSGYYRFQPRGDLLARLQKHASKLTMPERVAMLTNVAALQRADLITMSDAVAFVEPFAKDDSRHTVSESLSLVMSMDELVPPQLRPNYQRLIRKLFAARAKKLGFVAGKGEDDDEKQLRPTLIGLVANKAEDPALIAEATRLAWAWLDDRKAVQPEMVGTVLSIAARHGDKKLWERFYAEAKKAGSDRQARGRFLGAMADFRDPAIIEANFAIVLSGEFELRESLSLMQGAGADPRTRPMVWAFVRDNFDAIAAKMPRGFGAYLTFTPVALCSEEARAEMEAFFDPRVATMEGGPRIYAQAKEQMALCIESRRVQAPGVIKFLEKQ
jgi:alanyl aminopeptidase